MNEDNLYVEISSDDYINLKDRSGYYKVINKYDIIKYYKDDYLHRLNGPAYIDQENKIYIYFQNGNRHRLNSPAYIDTLYDYYVYCINNKEYTKKEFDQHPEVIQYRIRKFQEFMK